MFNESAPTHRDAQKAETRRLLLVTAREQLERLGYERTSLRGVAREAGVSPATVVFHFGDKPGLLHAALFDELEAAMRATLDGLPADGPVRPWLVDVARGFWAYYAQRPALSRALLRHSLLAEGEWQARFRGQYERLGGVIAGRLHAAMQAGEISPTLDLEAAITAYFAAYLFLLIDAAQADFVDLDARAALLDRMLAAQLGAPAVPSASQELL